MTCEQLEAGKWRLTFAQPEAIFLTNVMSRLARHYEDDLAGLSPAVRTFWQSGSSLQNPATASDDTPEVLADAREELRSERRLLAENWVRELDLGEEPWPVELTAAERDDFVSMLNDRRLLLSLEAGITGEAMTGDLPPQEHRAAVLEIDVLGHFIMVALGPQIYRS